MKKFVILEEGDFCISLPGARKTIIVQNKEVYISDTNSYPGDIEFTKIGEINKEG
jgi:hypothetical protein